MKRASFRRSQRTILWLGVLPALLAWISYNISSAHIVSVEATLATDEFIRRLDDLLSTIQDMETGQRGYLLTGQEIYLQPFNEGIADLPSRLSRIEGLASSHGVTSQQIRDLHAAIDAKAKELQKTIDLRRQQDLPAALREVNTNRGHGYMLRIRSLIDAIKEQQMSVFRERLDSQRRKQVQLEVVLAIGVLLAFVLVYLAHRFSVAYSLERDRAEKEVWRLHDSLEQRVKERTAELQLQTQELEKRSTELQRSNADLTQFAYLASHDLQEPLRMIASYIALLARRYQNQLDETAQRYVNFVIDGANRMETLIHDLLAYSSAGTQAVKKEPIPAEKIVQVALRNLEIPIKESSATVTYNDLPVIEADRVKLTQVMQNLIGNAIKFHKSGVSPEISITAQHAPGEWIFGVSDNGIGFDPAYSDRMFQVFQRLHAVGKYPGNGIGLAICKRIIEHHGGRLWAESQPGAGATFLFSLPVTGETRDGPPDGARGHPLTQRVPEPFTTTAGTS